MIHATRLARATDAVNEAALFHRPIPAAERDALAEFIARRRPRSGMAMLVVKKFATCPRAWTPASVRDAPETMIGWLASLIASTSALSALGSA